MNKLITGILVLILVGILAILGNFLFSKTKPQELTNPDGKNLIQQITKQNISPTPSPTPTPIIFNFDKTTNLKTELDSINPEVLDSDFDSLKQTTISL